MPGRATPKSISSVWVLTCKTLSGWTGPIEKAHRRRNSTDAMIDAIFIVGGPGDRVERLAKVRDAAREQGFLQMMFSELGPDGDEALALLCDKAIPAL